MDEQLTLLWIALYIVGLFTVVGFLTKSLADESQAGTPTGFLQRSPQDEPHQASTPTAGPDIEFLITRRNGEDIVVRIYSDMQDEEAILSLAQDVCARNNLKSSFVPKLVDAIRSRTSRGKRADKRSQLSPDASPQAVHDKASLLEFLRVH